MAAKEAPYKIYLAENEIPNAWYNVRADMKTDHRPIINPATMQPVTVADLERRIEGDVEYVYAKVSVPSQSATEILGEVLPGLIGGIYWKKSSQKGAIAAMICTAVAAVAWVAIKLATGSYPLKFGSFAVSETYIAVVVAAVCTIIFSLVFKPSEIEMAEREQTKAEVRKAMETA